MNKTAKEIVWYATVAALVFAARMLDHLFTGWFSINAAIVTLAVVYICIFVRPTLLNAVLCGTVFGIMSLLTSLMFPGGFTQYFVNPLVSVLPRILVGVAVYFVYILIRKAGKKIRGAGDGGGVRNRFGGQHVYGDDDDLFFHASYAGRHLRIGNRPGNCA